MGIFARGMWGVVSLALLAVCSAQQPGLEPAPELRQQAEMRIQQQALMQAPPATPAQPTAFLGQQHGPIVTGAGAPGPPPSYVSGMPQPYPMASPYSMGHIYGGYGVPVHPAFRALHAFIGAPPPPVIPYGAPYYPPYQ